MKQAVLQSSLLLLGVYTGCLKITVRLLLPQRLRSHDVAEVAGCDNAATKQAILTNADR